MIAGLSGQKINAVSFDNKNQKSNNLINSNLKKSQNDTFSFKGSENGYENPVSKPMEYFSASIGPVIISAIAGAGAGLLAKKEGEAALLNKKWAAGVGLGALLLTLPVAIYHRSVSAFAKQKEMAVFSREKSAETALSEQIDEKARDMDVPLDDAIKSYTNFEIGRQGRAVGIVNT